MLGGSRITKPALRFVNVVWGKAYTELFLELSLPSQLTPRNLPAPKLVGLESSYTIYTTKEDEESIRSSAVYRALTNLMPVVFCNIDQVKTFRAHGFGSYDILSGCHTHFLRSLSPVSDGAVFLTPDSIYADGAFAHLCQLACDGRKVVAIGSFRITRETARHEYLTRYRTPGGVKPITGPELVDLALRHLHPETLSMVSDSPFSALRHHWYWMVKFDGILLRGLHLHPLYVRVGAKKIASFRTIDRDFINRVCDCVEDLHVVDDSDNLCVIELTGLRDLQERPQSQREPVREVVRWMNSYAHAVHREFIQTTIKFHKSPLDRYWQLASEEADTFLKPYLSLLQRQLPALATDTPSLAVCILLRGHREAAERTLHSIATQEGGLGQVVLCGTSELLTEIEPLAAKLLPDVQLISVPCASREPNTAELNRTLLRTDCQFLLYLSEGVRMVEGYVHNAASLLAKYPAANLLTSDFVEYDEEHPEGKVHNLNLRGMEGYFSPTELMEYCSVHRLKDLPLKLDYTIIKREAFIDAGGFTEGLEEKREWLALRVSAFRGGLCYLPEPSFEVDVVADLKKDQQLEEVSDWGEKAREADLRFLRRVATLLFKGPYQDVRTVLMRSISWSEEPLNTVRLMLEDPTYIELFSEELLTKITLKDFLGASSLDHKQVIDRLVEMRSRLSSALTEADRLLKDGEKALAARDYLRARTIFEELIVKFVNFQDAYFGLAVAQVGLKLKPEAIATLTKLMQLNIDDPKMLNQIGTLYFKCDSKLEAERLFEKVLELDPNNVDACYNLGLIYRERGEKNLSADLLQKAMALVPNDKEFAAHCSELIHPVKAVTF